MELPKMFQDVQIYEGICVGVGLREEDGEQEDITAMAIKRDSKEMEDAFGCEVLFFSAPFLLASALAGGAVQVAVRGNLSSKDVIGHLKGTFSVPYLIRGALIEKPDGGPLLLGPVGIDEGRTHEQRSLFGTRAASFIGSMGHVPRVAVLSKGRLSDRGRHEDVDTSLDQGEALVEELVKEGIDTKHFGIRVEDAMKDSSVIIAPDGVVGNMLFRVLFLMCSYRSMGGLVLNIEKPFIETSRARGAYIDPILLALVLVSTRGDGEG